MALLAGIQNAYNYQLDVIQQFYIFSLHVQDAQMLNYLTNAVTRPSLPCCCFFPFIVHILVHYSNFPFREVTAHITTALADVRTAAFFVLACLFLCVALEREASSCPFRPCTFRPLSDALNLPRLGATMFYILAYVIDPPPPPSSLSLQFLIAINSCFLPSHTVVAMESTTRL